MHRRWIVPLFLLSALISWPMLAWTQRSQGGVFVEVHGKVELPDGHPAPRGSIVTMETPGGGFNAQAMTDDMGRFVFPQMSAGIYEVHVRVFGFLPEEQTVDLSTVRSANLSFTLRPDPARKDVNIPPGGPDEAIAVPLDPNAPDDARKDFESGRALLSSGKDLDKSVELFKKAIARYPEYSEAYLLMGAAYSSQGKWDEAEKAFRKTIDLKKNVGGAYVALGSIENEKKEYGEAEKYLLQAVELSPTSPDAHFELGRTYWGLHRWDVADQQLAKANALRPDNAGQHVLLGNIKLRERDAVGALAEFKQAVQLDPKGPMAAPTQQMIDKIEAALQAASQKK